MVIIIESPGKTKSIEKYTGAKTIATIGHIKDLPLKEIGVDLESFDPTFIPKDSSKQKHINYIKSVCKNENVYIATDADREGDAIAAMVYNEIKNVANQCYRMTFNEITKSTVNEAIKKAVPFSQFDWNKYDAFLGRRIGDRLVGYLLSGIAQKGTNWSKDDYMSVGRVQTISIRAVVDRENEIKNFKSEPYYKIEGIGEKNKSEFKISHSKNNFENKEFAFNIFENIKNESIGKIIDKEVKEVKSKPKPPYITSTIQAHASTALSLQGKQTMWILQKLFEGFGDGGMITYHRTDSPMISKEYSETIGEYLKEFYSEFYSGIREYKNKKSQAEAHEGIRPTMHPKEYDSAAKIIYEEIEKIKKGVGSKAEKLFRMICNRTLASQLDDAKFEKTNILISVKEEEFKTSGRILTYPGFLAIEQNEEEGDEDIKDQSLPNMDIGDEINMSNLECNEKFTTPPPRYTETSLIKKLEKESIGRPSTYASIIDILFSKKYAVLNKKQIIPQEKAFVLIDFMKKEYPFLIDYDFTSKMEESLDKVAEGKLKWKDEIENLYKKMGEPLPAQRSVTPKMKDFAYSLAKEKNISIDETKVENYEYIKNFIESNINYTPSEKQLSFALTLEEKSGMKLTDKEKNDYRLLSKWIDKAIKKQQSSRPLSEKQLDIVRNNAPKTILKILDDGGDINKVHTWLQNFFKKKKK